jgi:hypothetical protein
LLVSWCAGGRCGMACNDEDRGRSRRPGVEDQGWSHRTGTRWPGGQEVTVAGVGDLVQRTRDGRTGRVLGGRAVKRSGGTVCGLYLARGD